MKQNLKNKREHAKKVHEGEDAEQAEEQQEETKGTATKSSAAAT